jgi:hypothetical protein
VSAAAEIPPPRLQYELRDDTGSLLAAGAQDTAELGWNGAGEQAFRLDVRELPLADGRFHLRFGLLDARGERLYHWLDDAVAFVVYPAQDVRGPLRLDVVWSAPQPEEEIAGAGTIEGR